MTRSALAPAATIPWWAESAFLPRFPRIRANADADVVVVGGGMTGLMSAYLLAAEGRSVIVLERARCASIDTGHTSAHLTMVTDTPLPRLARAFGTESAQAVWGAGREAISRIESIARELEIDCGFARVDGYLHAPLGGRAEPDDFEDDVAAARELGFDAELVGNTPFVGGPGIRYADQARFHPRRFLAGLARAIEARGGRIHEHSPASEFSHDPPSVKVDGHTITFRNVVIATHDPLVGLAVMAKAARLQTRLALYTSYVIAARAPRGTVPDALFWDIADPYHFLRIEPHRAFDLVVFGGEDHKTGQVSDTVERFERLERTLAGMIPGVEPTHRWSGQVIETHDGLPYVGRTADHQLVATGYNGNGLTLGTVAAEIMCAQIMGRGHPLAELFSPERPLAVRAKWRSLRENVDFPWYKVRDRLVEPEADSLRSVRRGEGKVIERAGAKVAAYRNAAGEVTLRSALCTHMGCTVAWNDAEKTWDCPCHGSRFETGGKVISGPAESPLEKIE